METQGHIKDIWNEIVKIWNSLNETISKLAIEKQERMSAITNLLNRTKNYQLKVVVVQSPTTNYYWSIIVRDLRNQPVGTPAELEYYVKVVLSNGIVKLFQGLGLHIEYDNIMQMDTREYCHDGICPEVTSVTCYGRPIPSEVNY